MPEWSEELKPPTSTNPHNLLPQMAPPPFPVYHAHHYYWHLHFGISNLLTRVMKEVVWGGAYFLLDDATADIDDNFRYGMIGCSGSPTHLLLEVGSFMAWLDDIVTLGFWCRWCLLRPWLNKCSCRRYNTPLINDSHTIDKLKSK